MTNLISLFVASAHALTITQPQTHAQKLRDKIAVINPSVQMNCGGGGACSVTWNAENERAFHKIEAQTKAIRESLNEELDSIESKIDAGTASEADTKRAVKILLLLRKMK